MGDYLSQNIDMLLGVFLLFESRNKLVDFPYPWLKTAGALMIPSPSIGEKTQGPFSKIGAVWKPFQFQVAFFYLFILIFTDLLI